MQEAGIVGMVACLGGLFILLTSVHVWLRFQDVNVRRVISSLEWLATQCVGDYERSSEFDEIDRRERDEKSPINSALKQSHVIWVSVGRMYFGKSFFDYCVTISKISGVDLYWANRFATELRSFSLTLAPSSRHFDKPRGDHREHRVARHVIDFNQAATLALLGK